MAAAIDQGRALVDLTEALVGVSVAVGSLGREVPDEATARLSVLSSAERGTLSMFAPLAAPHLQGLLNQSPLAGVVVYAMVAGRVVFDRQRQLVAYPRKGRGSSRGAQRESGSSSSPGPGAEDIAAHEANWGDASDAVPPGTVPQDTGVFPDPSSETGFVDAKPKGPVEPISHPSGDVVKFPDAG